MDFIPKEICEKLMEMGCVSDASFRWCIYEDSDGSDWMPLELYLSDDPWLADEIKDPRFYNYKYTIIYAFTPWDFVGTSELARKNANILWSDMSAPFPCSRTFRHDCIDSDDAVRYIVDAVERAKK